MAEPVVLCKDYPMSDVYHQVYVDPFTGKSLVQQTALITNDVAEVIGTISLPSVELLVKQEFWDRFMAELRDRGVKRVYGKMPRHLYQHYQSHYGMQEIGTEADPVVGLLVIAERKL